MMNLQAYKYVTFDKFIKLCTKVIKSIYQRCINMSNLISLSNYILVLEFILHQLYLKSFLKVDNIKNIYFATLR